MAKRGRSAGSTKAAAVARREEQRVQRLHAKARATEKKEARDSKKQAKREAREAKAEQAREAAHASSSGGSSDESDIAEYTGEKPGHGLEMATFKGQTLYAARAAKTSSQLGYRLVSLLHMRAQLRQQGIPQHQAFLDFLDIYLRPAAPGSKADAEWTDEGNLEAAPFTLSEEISAVLERQWRSNVPGPLDENGMMDYMDSQETQNRVQRIQSKLQEVVQSLQSDDSNTLHKECQAQDVLAAAQRAQINESVLNRWDLLYDAT